MSRIRSQLEAIRRNSAQSAPASPQAPAYAGQPQYAPQPVQRPSAQNNEFRQPQMPAAEIDRIRERLDQLTGAIGSLARSQPQAAPQYQAPQYQAPQHQTAPQYAPRQAAPAPAPADDRNAAAALARLELLQREMVDVKSLLSQLASRDQGNELAHDMRRIAEGIARLQETPQAAPQTDNLAHLEEVAAELHHIREAVLALAQERDQFDPDAITRSMEDGYSRIAGRLDTLERHAQSASAPDLRQADAFAALSDQLAAMRNMVEHLPTQLPIATLATRLDEIAEAVSSMDGDQSLARNFRAMEERLDEITRALVALSVNPGGGDQDGLERVEARLAGLARGIEDLAAQRTAAPADGGYSSPVLDHIMMQLVDLSSRIDQAMPAGGPDLSQWPAQFVDPVLSRLDAMGARMDTLQSAPADHESDMQRLRSIEDQIAAIAYHVEQAPAAQPMADDRLAVLEQTLGAIASRLQTVSSEGVDLSPIATRLDSIEQHFLSAGDIAAQAAERAVQMYGQSHAQISGNATDMGGYPLDLGSITQKLESIEQQVAISRDMAMDAAAQAAERALHLAGQMTPATPAEPQQADPWLVEQLSRELQNLEMQAREFSHRHDDSFEGIRQSLATITDRLAGIEDDIRRATSEPEPLQQEPVRFAQPQHDPVPPRGYPRQVEPAMPTPSLNAPSLDASLLDAPYAPELALGGDDGWNQVPDATQDYSIAPVMRDEPEIEDVPLEPGSGVPDLAALVRDASKRRRASAEADGSTGGAQDFLAAARRAAQAAAQDAASASPAAETGGVKSKLALKLPAFLQNRRKLLMGASAAVLIIAAAIPIMSRLGGGGGMQPPAAADVSQAVPQDAPATEQTAEAAQPSEQGVVPVVPAEPAQSASTQSQQADAGLQPSEGQIEQPPAAAADGAAVQDGDTVSASQLPPVSAQADADAGVEIPAIPEEIRNTALRQAAEAGDPLALFEIARRYTDGDGVERSLETAAQWYEISARAGSAPAQYRLANFLEKGHGVKLDVEKSAMWYQRAAEQGNALAMHNLAVIYTSGLVGGKPDMESAIGWFLKAADFGVKDSQVNLGIIFAKGIGSEPDVVQAYKWLAVAARGGDTDAAAKRDTLAAAMRPEQLEKARGEAELWKPQTLDPAANVATPRPEWKAGGENAMLPGSSMQSASAQVTRDMIVKVQAQLAQMGYDPGPADGQMGTRTVDAVKAFQKKSGLPVDGQITGELLKKLDPAA